MLRARIAREAESGKAERMKRVMVLAAAMASLTTASRVFAQPTFQPPMGPFGRGGWSPWGGGETGDWLTWLALIAAAVFFVLWILERRKGSPGVRSESALDILKARYARGEIDEREFEQRRRALL